MTERLFFIVRMNNVLSARFSERAVAASFSGPVELFLRRDSQDDEHSGIISVLEGCGDLLRAL